MKIIVQYMLLWNKQQSGTCVFIWNVEHRAIHFVTAYSFGPSLQSVFVAVEDFFLVNSRKEDLF